MPDRDQRLTSRQKAAIFCINIGVERSAKILKYLRDEEIEMLTVEIAQSRKVTPEVRDEVFNEFIAIATADKHIRTGGIDYARDMLEKALGPEKARDILTRLTSHLRRRPFDAVRHTDPIHLASLLQNEHPQTVAVIMAHLDPDQAAQVLLGLPPERQADIIRRVATIDRTSPEMLREVERVLERKASAMVSQESTAAGGINWAVDVLNRVDRATEKSIMGLLSADDPELASEISQRMFLFDDIVNLDDRTVQRVLREVDMNKDLPLALKAAKEEVWRKIMNNVSKRTGEALREAVEYLGPVRIRDVEEAQARIVALIRRLEEAGEIQIARGGGADEYI
ncbi:MAG: flagellar motor switch protein FliG [Symbiobacterium sp.]|uniref:flagellar motor switch protein FliG n=1 Tax=Symbiobacterium sp. TaxID=1971213 RepID=UPI003464DF57